MADGTGIVTIEKYPHTQKVKDLITVLCPTIRTIIGLQYDMDFFKETQHLKFRAGFDARYYFNQYPVADRQTDRINTVDDPALDSYANITENNSFGMVGLILDLGWDY
ncbi:MAG: hypothetical protein SP1CHLAM9_10920 [Chlamydiia bacterium]|nr:hypothetical protein [Chlamydiia bacterium]